MTTLSKVHLNHFLKDEGNRLYGTLFAWKKSAYPNSWPAAGSAQGVKPSSIMNPLKSIARLFLFFLTFSSLSLFSNETAIFDGWTHLELGVGNYGLDGHTQASQEMTVLMKLEKVSDKANYIDDLEETGTGNYDPLEQFGVLFWTLDQLIERYGPIGIFHVNDLYEEYAKYAAEKLEEYAIARGYDAITIEVIPGDYQLIDSSQTLSQYGKTKYSSVHLKNPEASLYHSEMDGDEFLSSDYYRKQTRSMLQNLANLSETGLYLFILYHDNFIPLEERMEFMESEIFYHPTADWEAVPYIFPEGFIVDKEIGRSFHISPCL